jgi:hypothetical protein
MNAGTEQRQAGGCEVWDSKTREWAYVETDFD